METVSEVASGKFQIRRFAISGGLMFRYCGAIARSVLVVTLISAEADALGRVTTTPWICAATKSAASTVNTFSPVDGPTNSSAPHGWSVTVAPGVSSAAAHVSDSSRSSRNSSANENGGAPLVVPPLITKFAAWFKVPA